MINLLKAPAGLTKEEETAWLADARRRCLSYGAIAVVILIMVAMLAVVLLGSSAASAGGDDTLYYSGVTVFRGDGETQISPDGDIRVIKEPTKRAQTKHKKTGVSSTFVAAGYDTLWFIDNNRLHACNTIGTGYTGGSQRITCTK